MGNYKKKDRNTASRYSINDENARANRKAKYDKEKRKEKKRFSKTNENDDLDEKEFIKNKKFYKEEDISKLNGDLIMDETGKNKYKLPAEQLTFIKQAERLLDGDANVTPEYQYQFAYTIFNQLIGMDDNERLLFVNMKITSNIMRTFLLWSDSQLFYAFIDKFKGKWIYLACGKFSSNVVSDILTQLSVDRDSGNPEFTERANEYLKVIAEELNPLIDLITNACGWNIVYKLYKLIPEETYSLTFIKSILDYLKENQNWYKTETSIHLGKFLDKFLSYSWTNKASLPESVVQGNQDIWECIFGFPVSSEFKENAPEKLHLQSEHKNRLVKYCESRSGSGLIQLFIQKQCTPEFLLQLYEEFFKEELTILIDNENGLYVVVSLLKSLKEKEAITSAVNVFLNRKLSYYWNSNMRNLVSIIVEISAKYNIEQEKVFESLDSMVRHPIRNVSKDENNNTPKYERTNLIEVLIVKSGWKQHIHERFDRFGSLVICNLFEFKPSIIKPIFKDFDDFSKDDLFDLCSDRWGSQIAEKWIETVFSDIDIPKKELKTMRTNLVLKFIGSIPQYARHIFGSRIVEQLINHLDSKRLTVVLDEFLAAENECKGNKYCKILFAKYGIQGYKLNPKSWIAQHEKSKKISSMFSSLISEDASKIQEKSNNKAQEDHSKSADKISENNKLSNPADDEKRRKKLEKLNAMTRSAESEEALNKTVKSSDITLGKRSRPEYDQSHPRKKRA